MVGGRPGRAGQLDGQGGWQHCHSATSTWVWLVIYVFLFDLSFSSCVCHCCRCFLVQHPGLTDPTQEKPLRQAGGGSGEGGGGRGDGGGAMLPVRALPEWWTGVKHIFLQGNFIVDWSGNKRYIQMFTRYEA